MNVVELIDRLRRIPDDARTYDCDVHFASLHFGFDEAALRELADAGVPCVEDESGMRFDTCDLHYIGLRLGTATTYLWAIQRWVAGLKQFTAQPATHVTVTYVAQLAPGASAQPGTVRLPSGEDRAVVLEQGRCVAEARLELRSRWPALPRAAAAVAREVAESLSFCLLPAALQGDVELVRRIGMSDCLTAASVIVAEWRRAGLEARVSSGLLVSLPYSSGHGWPELRSDDGTWIPMDPLMIRVMCDHGGLDASRWPPDRSLGPILLRTGDVGDPLLTSGRGTGLSLMTVVA